MKKFEITIEKFLEKYNFKNQEDVLGILLYGSYAVGNYNKRSDLDILVIRNNDNPETLYRGLIKINGYYIEWFEKPIADLYENANNDYKYYNNASVSVIVDGKILYQKNEEVDKLKSYIKDLFSKDFIPIEDNIAIELIAILNNRMKSLKKMYKENNPFFNNLYFLTLDKIRKLYHKLNQIPEIQTSKIYKIYTDQASRDIYNIKEVPGKKFMNLYFKAIKPGLTNKEQFDLISKIYSYTKKDLNLNDREFRIIIKSKNLNNRRYF